MGHISIFNECKHSHIYTCVCVCVCVCVCIDKKSVFLEFFPAVIYTYIPFCFTCVIV